MSKLTFDGRVAVVTGAGRGMGRSHALMLASRGARVVVNDIPAYDGSEHPADVVVREIKYAGGEAIANHDSVLTSPESIIGCAVDGFGGLDIVVNNAGVYSNSSLSEANAVDWRSVFEVHHYGTVGVTRAAWPHLVRSGTGRIISTASSAMLGNGGLTSYGSAKGAIWAFMRSIGIEGEPHGITAHSILPTAQTRMTDAIEDPKLAATVARCFQPEHVSALVVWLAHQDTHINNESWRVSAGCVRRMTFAAYPAVRVAESTPEQWASKREELMANGPLVALNTLAEMFGNELSDAEPETFFDAKTTLNGVGLKPTSSYEVERETKT